MPVAEVTRAAARCALAALGIALLASAAPARHRHHAAGAAGEFDYYVLSLSWSPAYCEEAPRAAECSGPRHYGFIVHGLWPQFERGWPEHCADGYVADDQVRAVADLMPARSLVQHEWVTHGTCSGLSVADFFALVRRAAAAVAIPPAYFDGAVVQRAPSAVADDFLRANPRLPAAAVVVTCSRQAEPRLKEVHVCFTRGLEARACALDEQREACRAPMVWVPKAR